jgi:signal transduction histidine kinase
LVTSKAEREMRVEGLELGADDYVTKPFHPRELLARVRSFARLKLLQDDLTCNNAALSNALEQLKAAQSQLVHQEKMASLGQLVAGIAHEINNPVHFIQGNLDFLEEALQSLLEERRVLSADQRLERNDGLGGDLASILSGIREGVARTVGIVKDLRTFSRLDRAEMIEIDLRESLDATLNLLRAKLRTIEVLRDYGTLPLVECLAGQIGQVFMNLIVNAIDAVGDGGRIRIRTGHLPDAGFAFVEIEDNGSGMAPEVASQIFNPFFTTKEIGKGTGLGLSVSHGIIERHKGSIRVSSEVGVGSTFRVELPISMSKAEASVPEPHLERG